MVIVVAIEMVVVLLDRGMVAGREVGILTGQTLTPAAGALRATLVAPGFGARAVAAALFAGNRVFGPLLATATGVTVARGSCIVLISSETKVRDRAGAGAYVSRTLSGRRGK